MISAAHGARRRAHRQTRYSDLDDPRRTESWFAALLKPDEISPKSFKLKRHLQPRFDANPTDSYRVSLRLQSAATSEVQSDRHSLEHRSCNLFIPEIISQLSLWGRIIFPSLAPSEALWFLGCFGCNNRTIWSFEYKLCTGLWIY